MRKRNWIILAIAIILVFLCGLMLFIGYATYRVLDVRPDRWFHVNTVWETRDESKTLKVEKLLHLEVHNENGNVDIQTSKGKEVVIDLHKRAGGINQAQAQKNLENIQVEITNSGKKLVIDTRSDVLVTDNYSVDMTIQVPEETAVFVDNQFGDIALSGTSGDAELVSDYGSLTVEEISGALSAVTDNGPIEVIDMHTPSGLLDLKTDFGDIVLKSIRASSVTVETSNGAIEASNLVAEGDVHSTSDFGSIRYDDVKGENIEAVSDNGSLTLINVVAVDNLHVSTDLGDVDLQDVKADDFQINTSSGHIDASNLDGSDITAISDFGELNLTDCSATVLTLNSKNGRIEYQGKLGHGPHDISTDFGDILLTLPSDSSLSLDARSDFGTFKTDFDLLLTGDLDGNHWLGKIGDGDAELKVSTNNGNISIFKIKSEK